MPLYTDEETQALADLVEQAEALGVRIERDHIKDAFNERFPTGVSRTAKALRGRWIRIRKERAATLAAATPPPGSIPPPTAAAAPAGTAHQVGAPSATSPLSAVGPPPNSSPHAAAPPSDTTPPGIQCGGPHYTDAESQALADLVAQAEALGVRIEWDHIKDAFNERFPTGVSRTAIALRGRWRRLEKKRAATLAAATPPPGSISPPTAAAAPAGTTH
jgi:uncharacterized protein YbjQ (UPF0145 family)